MTLPEAVSELRKRLNLTQQEMATQMGLSMRTISGYETGDTPGSYEVMARFANLARQNGFHDLVDSLLLNSKEFHKLVHAFSGNYAGFTLIELKEACIRIGDHLQAVQNSLGSLGNEVTKTTAGKTALKQLRAAQREIDKILGAREEEQ